MAAEKINNIVRGALLLGVGVFIFLAPIKFGMPIDTEVNFPKDIYQWLICSWPHEILQIGVLILFTLWIVWGLTASCIKIRYSLLDVFILIFLLSALASVFYAPNKHAASLCFIQYLCYFAVYYILLNILKDKEDLAGLLKIIVIPMVFISLYAVYQYFIGFNETRNFVSTNFSPETLGFIKERLASNRVFATFVYPNALAGYLLLCIPMCIGILFGQYSRAKKILWTILIFVSIYVLFLTFHTGSGSVGKITRTTINRWEYWTAGARMIKDRPFLGVGLDNFSGYYPKYKTDIAEETRYAHNAFLQVWSEQGIYGFMAFCLIWLAVLKKGIKGIKRFKGTKYYSTMIGLVVGLIFFILHNIVDFDWHVTGAVVVAFLFVSIIVWMSGAYKEKIFILKKSLVRASLLFIAVLCFILGVYRLEKIFVAHYYLDEAKAAYENKNIPLAEVLVKVSQRFDGKNPDTYFMLAKLCALKNDYSQGILFLKNALKYDPNNPMFYCNIGLSYIYQAQKYYDENLIKKAGGAFKKAVELCPASPYYILQLARFYDADKQYDLALFEYKKCMQLNEKIERENKKTNKILEQIILSAEEINQIKQNIKKIKVSNT